MQTNQKRKHPLAVPIAGIFVLLAVVGAVTVIVASIRLTAGFLDNSSAKVEMENIIRPVMMFDPVPFENPADISENDLLLYSMWSCIKSGTTYTTGEDNNELRVPASDLDVACARLFGDGVTLVHQGFGDYVTYYYYDSDDGFYYVPRSADLYVYDPLVEEIEKGDEPDTYLVRVGYIPPVNAWTLEFGGENNRPAPEKHMQYVMRKSGGGYQIMALRDVDIAPLAEEPAVMEVPAAAENEPPESDEGPESGDE